MPHRHGEAAPQTVEELLPGSSPGHRGEGARHPGQGVAVAASDRGEAGEAAGEARMLVVGRRHAAVQGLDEGEVLQGQVEVGELPRPREGGIEMVDAGGNALLGQVGEEGLGIVALPGDPLVLRLGDVEDVDVELPPGGEPNRDLLAHEGVGQGPQIRAPPPRCRGR